MRRGQKPAKSKAQAKRPVTRKSPKDEGATIGDLENRLAATAEILRLISSSPADAQPVFEAIADSAMRLFRAWSALVFRCDGELLSLAAARGGLPGSSESFLARFQAPRRPDDNTLHGTAVITRAVQHIADVEADAYQNHHVRRSASERGFRSVVWVPMLRGNEAVGAVGVSRVQPGGFSDAEIALLQTFADQAVIAIENVRLFKELESRNRDLTEALEQQTATSDILRVISSSPTDVQPVFDTIVKNAVRLCDAVMSNVQLFDGERMHWVAQQNISPETMDSIRQLYPMRPVRSQAASRAILARSVVHLPDVLDDPEYDRQMALKGGWRSVLSVPMLRGGNPIGTITVARREAFTRPQIALLQTFADQAVIAIENVRLFNETKEALEQQTATSEILRVISSSPTDLQPVLDTVAERAASLCGAFDGGIFRVDGARLRLVALHASISGGPAGGRVGEFTIPLTHGTVAGRAVLERRSIHVTDLQEEIDEFPEGSALARRLGHRTTLSVPLLREGVGIGCIQIRRSEVQPFTQKQVELLLSFADQAVIAIENVRLFTELQEKNKALTVAHAQVSESLDQQTATAEILRVISSSPTGVRPVFEAIAAAATTLCGSDFTGLFRFDGNLIHFEAQHGWNPEDLAASQRAFPQPPGEGSVTARAILAAAVVQVADVSQDPAVVGPLRSFRTVLSVPMLQAGRPLGAITVARRAVGPFSEPQIALLRTFAEQAVIAIENVRLFTELQGRTEDLTRSVGELTALGAVSQALSSTLDVDIVLDTIVARANDLIGADGCTIFEYDEATEQFHLRATRNLEPRLIELARGTPLRRGDQGILGRLPSERQPVQVPDITMGSYSSPISAALIEAGYRAVVAVPLIREDHLIGALTMNRKRPGEFPAETIELLQTFATQSALAIQNARLFREIEIKSRQLEAASQHKSEFLANMSHELRTPLNAIIGFSEVLSEKMFGELNEKQEEYSKDIHASGQHLLSLINDILDLSKIEAGRMELELSDFHLPTALDSALTLVRERAGRRGIALHSSVDERLGQMRADERKVRQVVLNLLSNAIKFTPEGGRIEVAAVSKDGLAEVSVTDTGAGIAPEDQEAIFEEFRQVGTADKKVEGTGLGLTLCRKFIELHGGRIWVKSQLGAGSTFTFTIPLRQDG